MTERITPLQFQAADGVEDWRVVGEGACTYFHTGSFAASARLVHAIGEVFSVEDHHPDVDVMWGGVQRVSLGGLAMSVTVMPEVRVVVAAGSDANRARPCPTR